MITKYKDFSYLGLGIMRHNPQNFSLTKEIVDYSIEHGINYFESCYFYLNNQCEQILQKALASHPRDSYKLCAKMPVHGILEAKKNPQIIFEEQKSHLKTDYFDVYLLQALDRNALSILKDTKVLDFLFAQKEKGTIKQLGFSFHDSPEWLEKYLKLQCWDLVQLQLNYYDWYLSSGKENYLIAKDYNMPIFVMGPTKGGTLINEINKKVLTKNNKIELPYLFLNSLDNVKCILTGANTMKQIIENINIINSLSPNKDIESDINNIMHDFADRKRIECTNCNYCQPCPVNIPISYYFQEYNKILAEQKNYKHFETYLNHLRHNQPGFKCLECGRCEKMCPQHLPIRHLLKTQIFDLRY